MTNYSTQRNDRIAMAAAAAVVASANFLQYTLNGGQSTALPPPGRRRPFRRSSSRAACDKWDAKKVYFILSTASDFFRQCYTELSSMVLKSFVIRHENTLKSLSRDVSPRRRTFVIRYIVFFPLGLLDKKCS